MKNHIKQMLRTPVQSVLIIVLVMIVTVMLSVGGNLWVASDKLSKMYEEEFITVGTVTQKPDIVVEEPRWDAQKKDYRTQTSQIKNGICSLKNQYFSSQNSAQAAAEPNSNAFCMYFGSR